MFFQTFSILVEVIFSGKNDTFQKNTPGRNKLWNKNINYIDLKVITYTNI